MTASQTAPAARPALLRRVPGRIYRSYAARRVLKAVLTVYLVATGTFFLVRLLPGNPVQVYINTQMSQYGISYQDAASQAAGLFSFNPNRPLVAQYGEYLAGLARGNLGQSI